MFGRKLFSAVFRFFLVQILSGVRGCQIWVLCGTMPLSLRALSIDAAEHQSNHVLVWAGGRQSDFDSGFELFNPDSDFEEVSPDCFNCRLSPFAAFWRSVS